MTHTQSAAVPQNLSIMSLSQTGAALAKTSAALSILFIVLALGSLVHLFSKTDGCLLDGEASPAGPGAPTRPSATHPIVIPTCWCVGCCVRPTGGCLLSKEGLSHHHHHHN